MELTKEEKEILKSIMNKVNSVDPKEKKEEIKGRAVVVTTANNGIFFGYAEDTTGETITLKNCRNAFYWEHGKGFIGLSQTGPGKNSKIGDRGTLTLRNITSVAECTEQAAMTWEKADWK